jgi:uncharacterized membrane protein YphA (DoxX/SURF4 family)
MTLALRLILGITFLYAGIIKASASQAFAIALLPFTFIDSMWTGPLAMGLAWMEILAGVLVLAPRIYETGAAVIAGLCLVFIAVLSWALWNGYIVSCGCFGEDMAPSAAKMLLAIGRDILLFAGAVAIMVIPRLRKNL